MPKTVMSYKREKKCVYQPELHIGGKSETIRHTTSFANGVKLLFLSLL
jgi:hypothetical protein